uniref:Uncharacterized protein n=1 Tax=Lygus hesperus TaxID=30085 RepID=A0A0A9XPT8_LYGHE
MAWSAGVTGCVESTPVCGAQYGQKIRRLGYQDRGVGYLHLAIEDRRVEVCWVWEDWVNPTLGLVDEGWQLHVQLHIRCTVDGGNLAHRWLFGGTVRQQWRW